LSQKSAKRHFLLIRPEKIEILDHSVDKSEFNLLAGRVAEVNYQGEYVLIAVLLHGGQRVYLRRPTGQNTMRGLPARGEDVQLGIHPADTVFIPED